MFVGARGQPPRALQARALRPHTPARGAVAGRASWQGRRADRRPAPCAAVVATGARQCMGPVRAPAPSHPGLFSTGVCYVDRKPPGGGENQGRIGGALATYRVTVHYIPSLLHTCAPPPLLHHRRAPPQRQSRAAAAITPRSHLVPPRTPRLCRAAHAFGIPITSAGHIPVWRPQSRWPIRWQPGLPRGVCGAALVHTCMCKPLALSLTMHRILLECPFTSAAHGQHCYIPQRTGTALGHERGKGTWGVWGKGQGAAVGHGAFRGVQVYGRCPALSRWCECTLGSPGQDRVLTRDSPG